MSPRQRPSPSGLTLVEIAVLQAVKECGASAGGPYAPSTAVLELVDARTGVGPRYAHRILVDLTAAWVRHLPLLDGEGNFGSVAGDQAAEPQYTQVRLSPVGELALASEQGAVGPLPLDLVEGSMYRGGGLPPFDPALTIRALLAGAGSAGPPRTPTGTITADPTGPMRRQGRWVQRYQLGAVIRSGGDRHELVLTEPPYLVGTDLIVTNLQGRIEQALRAEQDPLPYAIDMPSVVPPERVPVFDIADMTSGRTGTRIVLRVKEDVDIIDAADWVRSVWPVTVHVDGGSYEETYDRFALWDELDKSGVRALDELIHGGEPTPD